MTNRTFGRLALATTLALSTAAFALADHDEQGRGPGRIYTMSNAAEGNALHVLQRNGDGTLDYLASLPTGGIGTGGGLGNQGAVTIGNDGRWIAVVNAGDDTVSIFRNGPRGPRLASRFMSGGVRPISTTWDGRTLFVLNDGDANNAPNIQGFRVSHDGTATAIPGAWATLSSATTDPAQIQFSPDGEYLVVAEKNTNAFSVFEVEHNGEIVGMNVVASAGVTPFGFDFDNRGRVFVSEAFGGAPNGSATSSYDLVEGGALVSVSAAVPTNQTAACWLDVSPNGRWAYVGNAGSGSLSTYRIYRDGAIELVANSSLGMGARALDTIVSRNGQFVHVINSAAGSVVTFRANGDGTLTKIDEDAVALGINGLATY